MELKRVEASQMFAADGQCCEIKMCSLAIRWENSEQVINYFSKFVSFMLWWTCYLSAVWLLHFNLNDCGFSCHMTGMQTSSGFVTPYL